MPHSLSPQQQAVLQRDAQVRAVAAAIRARQESGELPPDPIEAAQMFARISVQKAAETEILGYAAHLSPEHVQHLQRLEQTGGPQAVLAALQSTGLPRHALEVLEATYAEVGSLAGVAERVQGRLADVATENWQRAAAEGQARWEPSDRDDTVRRLAKQQSEAAAVMRDPGANAAAVDFCRRLGLVPPRGQSPLEFVMKELAQLDNDDGLLVNAIRRPGEGKWTREEQLAGLAKALGQPVSEVKALIERTNDLAVRHGLAARTAERDAPAQDRIAAAKLSARDRQRISHEDRRRATLEAAAPKETESRSRPQRAAPAAPEASHEAERPARMSGHYEMDERRATLEAAMDDIEAQDSGAAETEAA